MVQLRQMTADDLDFVLGASHREGWASSRHRLEIHLEHDPGGAFIAEESGARVGMVTSTRYGASGFVGSLIVTPRHRSRGIGRLLMERALDHLHTAGVTTVRLDADPPGVPLYRSLGFVDEWESCRFRIGAATPRRAEPVRPARFDEIDAVISLDQEAFGVARPRLIRLLVAAAEHVLVVDRGGSLVGFLIAERTSAGYRVGPAVAPDREAAESLLAECLRRVDGQPVTIGTPAPARELCAVLEAFGFAATPSSLRMVRGPGGSQGRTDRVLAIAGGDVG